MEKIKSQPTIVQPTSVGESIRRIRCLRHLKQSELAVRASMEASQLCNIERDKNSPSVSTLERIAKAMNVTLVELLNPPESLQKETVAIGFLEESAGEGAKPTATIRSSATVDLLGKWRPISQVTLGPSHASRKLMISSELMEKLNSDIQSYQALENACCVRKQPSLSLVLPVIQDERGAESLARRVRMSCGIGDAALMDIISLLEMQGIRIRTISLPEEISSIAFFDATNANMFIFVRKELAHEQQQVRVLMELAGAYLYTNNGCFTVADTSGNRRFVKRFIAAFLMPEETLRAILFQMNIQITQWTYDLVLRLKQRFGVSADAFINRLEELNLITLESYQAIAEHITAYYGEYKEEPAPIPYVFERNIRYIDLERCAHQSH